MSALSHGRTHSDSGLVSGPERKRRQTQISSQLRKDAPWLKTLLVQCDWAAIKKKYSSYKAQFDRLKARRGPKKAICAVAASMPTAIYHA